MNDHRISRRSFLAAAGIAGAAAALTGVEVEAEGHARVLCRVGLTDGGEGLGEGCGGKHDQLHALGCL